jgi:hypothetical protein
MDKIKFQYYPANIESTKPLGFVFLNDFIGSIKDPSKKIKDVFKSIAAAELSGDKKLKAQLKQNNLFYFTPCIISNGKTRGYKDVTNWTGLAVLDFDHIDNADEFRDYMFKTYKFIVTCFLSASKKGIKVLIKIPVVKSTDEFKSFFYGLGVLFDKYKGFDGTAQNCVLPLFLSYDKDILFRDNATVFKGKGIKVDAFKENINVDLSNVVINSDDSKRVYSNIEKAFNNIVSDGHPQVIGACISLGGYVAAGYVDEAEAVKWVSNFITNNNYLKKGISGYIKTAKTAIKKGAGSPLILN